MKTPLSLEGSNDAAGLMINHLFVQRVARERQLKAPLLPQREEYLRHLTALGRKQRVVSESAVAITHIIRLTEFGGSDRVSEEDISTAANLWIEEMRQNSRFPSGTSARSFKSTARSFFRFLGVYGTRQQPPWFEACLSHFAIHMSREHLPSTVRSSQYTTRGFLRWVASRRSDLSSITIDDVDDFMSFKRSAGWRPRTFVGLCRDLRSFFRFTEGQGWTDRDLGHAIKAPWFRASRDVPKGPSWNQVRRRIAVLDGTNPSHCRGKAILLLAAIYGLRTCEIGRLTLEDFDWYNEVMTVRRAKRGRLQQFPIQFEVGEAIIRYLMDVRPACQSRNVFITIQTPYRPVTNLGPTIRRLLNATSIFQRPYGLHALRHACATELLRKGTSLRGIADFLGHRDLRAVSIYAHCDVRVLRKVADMSLKGVL